MIKICLIYTSARPARAVGTPENWQSCGRYQWQKTAPAGRSPVSYTHLRYMDYQGTVPAEGRGIMVYDFHGNLQQFIPMTQEVGNALSLIHIYV